MNNEDTQAIRHAVAAGIREATEDAYDAGYMAACRAAPVCQHCGTPWTWYQRRGYDKHPCEAWRTERATGHPRALQGRCSISFD